MLSAVVLAAVLGASPVTVVVNGTPVPFDQAPVERAGRIYVPLRGVFERLGATVVYSDGTINATQGSHTIQLKIGGSSALVDGTTQALDAPPFLAGARTLVPLRFIAQALGANVDYSGATRTVSIGAVTHETVVVTPVPSPTRPPAPRPPVAIPTISVVPGNGLTVRSIRPHLAANFDVAIDPNTLHATFDGRDITATAYVANRSFTYDPDYDIPSGRHTVVLRGRESDGAPFQRTWTFITTNAAVVSGANFVRNVRPAYDELVGGAFTISGSTHPGAKVHIDASAGGSAHGQPWAHESATSVSLVADARGYFSSPISLAEYGVGTVAIHIVSVDRNGNSSDLTTRAAFRR